MLGYLRCELIKSASHFFGIDIFQYSNIIIGVLFSLMPTSMLKMNFENVINIKNLEALQMSLVMKSLTITH